VFGRPVPDDYPVFRIWIICSLLIAAGCGQDSLSTSPLDFELTTFRANGSAGSTGCSTCAAPDSAQSLAINLAIGQLYDDCEAIGDRLDYLNNWNDILVYSADDGNWATSVGVYSSSQDDDAIRIWSGTFTHPSADLINTLRHEYGHLAEGTALETSDVESHETSCDGFQTE